MKVTELTIGGLAASAGVGVETIRYYQRRNLLPKPVPKNGAFRYYPIELVDRICFIKRAQELGFSLDEILTLLSLEDGTDRAAIREVASLKLVQICSKIVDLQRMVQVLDHLIHECKTTAHAQSCPIISALAGS